MSSAGTMPLVSVLVPAFNAARTLRETLQSVLASTYSNLEVVVVDDGSVDGTAALVQALAGADPRVRLVQRANGGLSAALNTGFRGTSGDYIARLDADDLWHPSKLQKQMELAVREPELAFIYTWARYIDDQGRLRHDGPAQQFPPHALCRGMYESLVGGGSSALIKRSAIVEAGGWNEKLQSWMDLFLQLNINAKHPIGFVPEYLIGYRVSPGSLSSDPARMMRIWREVQQELKLRFPYVPRYVHRWAHARRCMMFAEGLAWRGRWEQSASLLLAAAGHDPRWTFEFLAFRNARRLKRRRFRTDDLGHPHHFLDCPPAEPLRRGPAEEEREGHSLHQLEAKRLEQLDALDRALAQHH